jgi:hypothetical protein
MITGNTYIKIIRKINDGKNNAITDDKVFDLIFNLVCKFSFNGNKMLYKIKLISNNISKLPK